MEYTSTIKSVVKKESFNTPDGALMNKYIVQFANGHNPNIYMTKEFPKNVGDEVSYNLDKSKNKAKLILQNKTQSYSNPKDDIQKFIIRQSCLDRATELLKDRNYNWELDSNRKKLTDLAEYLKNYVYNG
mgnify:CR=1 FL=1|jgi:hypothetical protein|tara:strand:+ start:126 stop:515 length:390 start_codon:yes stop_codon:yes gene_type:complete